MARSGGKSGRGGVRQHAHWEWPTDHFGWRDALVNLFHTTGTQDPRLRLIRHTRAKQDTCTGLRVTPDGLNLHVGSYGRQNDLRPPTQGAAYPPSAALMCILRGVLVDGEHQAPNADVVWPEPLRPRPQAPALVWLMTTDDQCAQAAEKAQPWAELVIVPVGAGQPRPWGLPHGIARRVAAAVPHDPHMAVHAPEHQPEERGTCWYINAAAQRGYRSIRRRSDPGRSRSSGPRTGSAIIRHPRQGHSGTECRPAGPRPP